MGQRQLVALMRVLMQKPAIFILDEATASIDPFTEWQIQQALNLILKNSTSILIAHRLSTVKAADRIVVMEKGGIIEGGESQWPARTAAGIMPRCTTHTSGTSPLITDRQGWMNCLRLNRGQRLNQINQGMIKPSTYMSS